MRDLWAFSKRKGFFFPAAEIYGGLTGFYDYGHLGTLLKKNWENLWVEHFVRAEENYHLIHTSNILPEKCLRASGHLEHFRELEGNCKECGKTFRVEDLIGEELNSEKARKEQILCPRCKGKLKLDIAELMFALRIGREECAFLRPETAQGAYLSFKREFQALRKKLPLGLAILGRAFRNEISPRRGMYRLRGFEQAELQIFFDPHMFDKQINWEEVGNREIKIKLATEKEVRKIKASDLKFPKFYTYHLFKTQQFYQQLCFPMEKFRLVEKSEQERSFYNQLQTDVEVYLDSLEGYSELAGIHYRTDYDLGRHQKFSKEKLEVRVGDKKILPHVLELSFGTDRNLWALLDLFYTEKIFKIPPRLAPKTVGVYPLVNRDGLPEKAKEVYRSLRKRYESFYDKSGSIGRRYARADEIGTPYGVTIDYQTLEDSTVTVRDKDTKKQIRAKIDELTQVLDEFLSGKRGFENAQ